MIVRLSSPRDAVGRLTCFLCHKPLGIRSTRDRDYGYCHGQSVVCSEEDLARLREYAAVPEKTS